MKQLDPKNRLLALCGILPKDAHQRFAADNWSQFCGFVNPLLAKIKRNTNGLKLPDVEGLETLMACSPQEAKYILVESYYAA